MKFHGEKSKVNFAPELQPLFDAMMQGEVIKSVTFCAGEINRHDRSKDRVLEYFIATDYWQGIQQSSTGESFDYVDTNLAGEKTSFYMSWVLSFEL